jgi:hypothetical protein
MADTNDSNIMAELSKINRRLTLMENRFSNLSDHVSLIENSLNDRHKSSGKNVSNIEISVKEIRDKVSDFELELKKFNGIISNFASKQDIKILERYINFWNPIKE